MTKIPSTSRAVLVLDHHLIAAGQALESGGDVGRFADTRATRQ